LTEEILVVSIIVVTGSGGLIGAEAVRYFSEQGYDVVGIDNDMRAYFFGPEASTRWAVDALRETVARYRHHDIDIRDRAALETLFAGLRGDIVGIVHTAAQPSHDWAAREPHTDFEVNAIGTLNILEAARANCPEAAFIFTSTNKVYGDTPNGLPLEEKETRYEIASTHPYSEFGIDESMSIDQSRHSLFGASKVSADVLVQEYGRYFGMKTACFRGGCLTGPGHSGSELHGFLSYLMICVVTGKPYTVFGYGGKQVRDNIHSHDLVRAFGAYMHSPKVGAVYNMGGGRHANCSMIEAIAACEERAGRKLDWRYSEKNRSGDHVWWISDVRRFQRDYPGWDFLYSLDDIYDELGEAVSRRYAA
jgi:CDP-paratose 2-epimerase